MYNRQEQKKTLMAHVTESRMPEIKAWLKRQALDEANPEAVQDFCLELHKWTVER